MPSYVVTADAATADLTPLAGQTKVVVTPKPPDDVPGVRGAAIVVDTAPDGDPDVILPTPLTETANAMGEVSFLLYPTDLTVRNPTSDKKLVYEMDWGRAEVIFAMPERHIRLRQRVDGVPADSDLGLRPGQLDAINDPSDGDVARYDQRLQKWEWTDLPGVAVLTQAEYDMLSPPDPGTVYFIVG